MVARLHACAGGAALEPAAMALAVPALFLHATYQPHVSIGLASTSIDVTLADVAIGLVALAAWRRAARDGFSPLRGGRLVLVFAALFVLSALVALATPALLGEQYAFARHAVSALKLAWYALLLPATMLLVRSTRDAVPLLRAIVVWSLAATTWGVLQFAGLVTEFQGKRPGQREPSFVGIHDFAALSGAALALGTIGLAAGDGRPLGRRFSAVALVSGALGVVCSGAMTGVGGVWLAVAVILLSVRAWGVLRSRRAVAVLAIVLLVSAGTAAMRATTLGRFAEFLGLRDRIEDTGVESYAQRTLLAYIGGRIWLDHPLTGVGWQASSERWAYAPYLADARARFPDEPEEAFPSPERPWGIQTLYLQVAADLGLAGVVALVGLFAAGIATAVREIRDSPAALAGLAFVLVAAGVWAGIGLVPGLPLAALTWLGFGLVTARA